MLRPEQLFCISYLTAFAKGLDKSTVKVFIIKYYDPWILCL